MQKIIPMVYFYLVSLIGFILFLIGIFASIHFLINVSFYKTYPLANGTSYNCPPNPVPLGMVKTTMPVYQPCLDNLQQQRDTQKATDAEKALSFTTIGLLVFATHFFYARKKLQ